MEFMEIYQEGGMVAVTGCMFMFLVYSLNKRSSEQAKTLEDLKIENRGQSETIENVEGILLKLLTRMDKSDERLAVKFSELNKEINDIDNQISEVKGSLSRVNGKN